MVVQLQKIDFIVLQNDLGLIDYFYNKIMF